MAEDATPLMEALTDEQIEQLRDGEELSFLIEERKPLGDSETVTSIDTLEIHWSTKGTYDGTPAEEAYEDDVIGIGDN